MARVLLSHAAADRARVRRLAEGLRRAGHAPWLIEDELRVGRTVLEVLEQGLRESDFVLACLSQEALRSGWVEAELRLVLEGLPRERAHRLLTVRLEAVELPVSLQDRTAVDLLEERWDEGLARLVTLLGGLEHSRSAGSQADEKPPQPGDDELTSALASCTPQARQVLAAATVFAAAPIPTDWLVATAGLKTGTPEAGAALNELEALKLLQFTDQRCEAIPHPSAITRLRQELKADVAVALRTVALREAARWVLDLESHIHPDTGSEFERRRPHIEELLRATSPAANPEPWALMSMLMGRVLGDRGEYAAARERLEQAAAVAEQSPALHIVALGSLHELVRLSRTQADSTRASSYLDSATKLAQGLPKELQHGSLSELWEQRAWVLLPRDPLAAKQAAQRALDLLDSAPETTASLKAQRLLVLGVCTQAVDGAAAAHPILHRALQLLEAAGLGDTPQAAKTLAALVGVLKQLGHLEEAEAAEEQALSIGSRKLESRAIAAASRLTNLAAVREAEGRLAEAKELLEQARDLLEARYGHDHGHLGTPLYNLGLMLLQLGDREGARACAERALKIFERVHGPDHPYSEASRALTFLTLTPESMEAERAWERFFSTGLTLYAPELGPGAEQLRRALVFVRSHHAHPAEVSNALSEALRAAEGQEDFGNAARAALLLGSFLGSQGAWETAQEHIERALRLARRAEHPLLIAEAYRLLGDANLHGSYYEDARLNYAEAIRRYEELGFKLKAARTRLLLLTMLVQLGRAQEIAPLLPSLRQALDAGVFTDTQERTDAEQALRLAESLRGAHPQGDTP